MCTFGGEIEKVLKTISIKPTDRVNFNIDATIIENAFIHQISQRDPFFKSAFRGLSLTGSYLDRVRTNLPNEFDMLTKVELPCFIELVPVRHHQSYIFLRVRGNNIPYHLTNQLGNEFYISRRKLQIWFRENIAAVIPLLQNIPCSGGRRYRLEYVPNGHVAHTIKAILLTNPCHFIDFDFVPAFAFSPREWPREFPRHKNGEQAWYAVPKKFKSPLAEDDPLSFIVAAPHWERMVLHKKQNLKDGYRLLKAVRDANDLPLLFSYTIKSVFLNDAKKNINWNQSPGKILIRAIVQTTNHLNRGFLPFFLVPKSNVLDHLQKRDIYNYKAKLFRVLKRLIKCRDRDSMSPADIKFIFGIEI